MSYPELYGLLLTGGQSSRMGEDKSFIDYHGRPQAEHLFLILEEVTQRAFISVKAGCSCAFTDEVIEDTLTTKGPINGILSAMRKFPDKAWLVLAVDLPLLSVDSLRYLVQERDSAKMATSYATRVSGLPEPLIAIWEPTARESLEDHHLVQEKGCPRKFLINSDIKLIYPKSDEEMYNANSPEEAQHAKTMIG